MKREIKFRAWDRNRKKMIFGPTDDNPNASWVLAASPLLEDPVMEFTGLKDKTGKEIYEGDILRTFSKPYFPAGGEAEYEKWDKEGRILIEHHTEVKSICQTIDSNAEVIGNIYENPSFLQCSPL